MVFMGEASLEYDDNLETGSVGAHIVRPPITRRVALTQAHNVRPYPKNAAPPEKGHTVPSPVQTKNLRGSRFKALSRLRGLADSGS